MLRGVETILILHIQGTLLRVAIQMVLSEWLFCPLNGADRPRNGA